jgi:hypothetical protein
MLNTKELEDHLSAPEFLVLLNPYIEAQEALKIGLKELIARGILRIEQKPSKSRFQPAQVQLLLEPGSHLLNPVLHRLWGDLHSACRHGSLINQVLQRLQKEYGPDYGLFKHKVILPSLLQRGLLQKQTHKALGIFPQTRYQPTPDGADMKTRLEHHMDEARRLLPSLSADSAQVVPLLLSLGSAALLLPGIASQFQQINDLMKKYSDDGGYIPLLYSGGYSSKEANTLEQAFQQINMALADAGDGGSDGGGGGE